MRAFLLFVLLAWIPTHLLIGAESSRHIEGVWYDYDTGVRVEIKDHRKGIKVKVKNGHFRRGWNTYFSMGRGVYDDCVGSALVVIDRHTLKWVRGRHRRPVYLERGREHRSWRQGGYTDRYYRDRVPYDRHRFDRRQRLSGGWFCSERGLSLDIELNDRGFRAREPRGTWIYYDRIGDDLYRDNRGNAYRVYGDQIEWQSNDGRRKFRFSKRD